MTFSSLWRTEIFSAGSAVRRLGLGFRRTYRGDDSFSKGDNNLFRSVWWGAVVNETVDGNPFLGLGFGHDLAERFVRAYYPESGE